MSKPVAASEAGKAIRLVLVEDDADYRKVATAELADLGFVVEGFADGRSMLASMASVLTADVIVLDWSLPGISGIDLPTQLRRGGIQLPVAFLTERFSLRDEHLAFDRGAVDFVDKSRGPQILAKRIRVIVEASRRPVEVEESIQRFGRLMLKHGSSRAFWDMVDVSLTLSEFKIVQLLVLNAGHHVTYRSFFDRVHSVGFVAGYGEKGYQTNVRGMMKRIRNKFRLIDPEFSEISNVASVGYSWALPAGELSGPRAPKGDNPQD